MNHPPPRERPTPEQIAALPPYPALPLSRIHVLRTAEQFQFAEQALREAVHVGFDTESKPTFVAGAPQTGPDIVQFATTEHAFIVPAAAPEAADFLRAMIESDAVIKVGFGLASDRPQLQRKLGVRLGESIDLSYLVRRLGFKQAVGLKAAVAIVLGQRLQKSKKATTSNWANPNLTPQQLQYAANDAHASLLVYRALSAQSGAP
ncbi:MAG TPA: 3'-5' exonuclease domain-containing protein 2 [Candidatus Aquabacterium excrementipullorum]|nr:3'-5' exonuclease domain-containing protein 2 [Candidatus Aquabacterium excrementipullorum]